MADHNSLIQKLDARLKEFGYEQVDGATIPDVEFISLVKQKKLLNVRNLCAVVNVPDNIKTNETAKNFFSNIRNSLLKTYGDAILWKELEICYVIFCESELFGAIKEDDAKCIAGSAFSLNSMVGSCFINTNNFEYFPHSTWGLYFSGDHFKAVDGTVKQWCQKQVGG